MNFWIVPGNIGIILGYVWLRRMNPEIDWTTSRISIRGGSGLVQLPSQPMQADPTVVDGSRNG